MNTFIIERDKIRKNAEVIFSRAGVASVIAVVKGRGYGFGIDEYVTLLHECGVRFFAVTEPSDAISVRKLNLPDTDILMLRSTSLHDELSALIENDIILTIGSIEAAVSANDIASAKKKKARIHVKIDTGMGRYGFSPKDTDGIVSTFTNFESLKPCGMFTHLSCAFKDKGFTKKQLDLFHSVNAELTKLGIDCGTVHFSNSAYLFNFGSPLGDAVRIGSAFTGRVAGNTAGSGLSRVGHLEGNICEIRKLSPGATVGYGRAYKTKRETRVAIIPIGYSDGFQVEKARDSYRLRDGIMYALMELKRTLSRKAVYVRINGKAARVLGHIGMTHTACDVTDIPCNVGDTAEFDVNPIYVSSDIYREFI